MCLIDCLGHVAGMLDKPGMLVRRWLERRVPVYGPEVCVNKGQSGNNMQVDGESQFVEEICE